MDIKIGVLKKGDKVISLFPYGDGFAIAIQRKGSDVDVIAIEKDLHGLPRIGSKILIRQGDDVVEVNDGDVKIMTG